MTDQAPLPRPTRRDDYVQIVKGLRPHVAGEELDLRSSLLLMRDRAMSTKPIACAPSWAILDVIEQVASESALNPRMGVEQLRMLSYLCLKCACTAKDFDTLFQPQLPLGEGEANAGA